MTLLTLLCFSSACQSFKLVSAEKTRVIAGRKSGFTRVNYVITLKVNKTGLKFDRLVTHRGVEFTDFNIKNLETGMETSNQTSASKGIYEIRYHVNEDKYVPMDKKAELTMTHKGKTETITMDFTPTPDKKLR